MIKSMKITGFKGFGETELPGMARVTLLGGRNNVGKTSILEALYMFYDRMNPGVILRQFAARGVPGTPLGPDSAWAPVFYRYDMDNQIRVMVTDDSNGKETMTIKYNPNFTEKIIPVEPSVPGNGIPQIRTDKQATAPYSLDISYKSNGKQDTVRIFMGSQGVAMHGDNFRTPGVPVTIFDARAKNNPNDDAERFGRLDVLGKTQPVLEALRVVEPGLKDLSVVPTGSISLVYGDIGIGRKIPVAFMGDGISRLLSFALAINTNSSGLVLIDEIENGLHYSVMPRVWQAIAGMAVKFNVQVVATTHSYEALEAAIEGLAGDMEKEFSYIRLEREKKDQRTIRAKTFHYDTLKVATERQWEVR